MRIRIERHIIWCIIIAGFFCQSFRPAGYEHALQLSSQDTTIGRYGYWIAIDDTTTAYNPIKKGFWHVDFSKFNPTRYIPPKRMDRGIVNHTFIPKGMWLTGVNISYYEESTDDYDFLILKDWKGSAYNLNVSPFFCYFIKDNLAIGGRFAYRNTTVNIGNLDISLGDDLSFGIKDAKIKDDTYLGSFFFRSYIGLDQGRRFGLFNETHLTVGSGKSRLMSGKEEALTDTHQRSTELQLGIQPGLGVFVTNEMHIEVSVGVAGLKYKHIRQITNGTETGSRYNSGMDFKLNILNIRLGIIVCL